MKGADKTLTPIQKIELEQKFVSNVDKTQFKVKIQKYNDQPDIRHNSELKIIDFILDDAILEAQIKERNHPLHRVDGNHRLKAAESATSEKAVFHNINTKTIPLTSEENLRVILDDEKNFPDDDLKDRFGWEYLATRKVFSNMPKEPNDIERVYPWLGKEFNASPRTFSKQIIRLLKITKG